MEDRQRTRYKIHFSPASTAKRVGFLEELPRGDACELVEDAELRVQGVRFAEPDEVWAAPLVLRYKPLPRQKSTGAC